MRRFLRPTPPSAAFRLPLLLATVAALFPPGAAADPDLREWGDVPFADLERTTWPLDPEANAIVLFDVGEYVVRPDPGEYRVRLDAVDFGAPLHREVHYFRHRRVKILTAAGLEHADVRIRIRREQVLRDFAAHTVGRDGRVLEVKAEHVVDQEDDWRRWKVFTFPGAEPGVILEYKYRLVDTGDDAWFRVAPWSFEDVIPVLVSTLTARWPENLGYHAFFTAVPEGSAPVAERARASDPDHPDVDFVQYRWTATDRMGLDPEPCMPALDDYRMSIRFQLDSHRPIGAVRFTRLWESWKDLGSRLYDSWRGAAERDADQLEEWTFETIEGRYEPLDRARAIHSRIRDELLPTEMGSRDPPRTLDELLERRHGSAWLRTMLMWRAMRTAGVSADPVLVRPRSHGTFHSRYLHRGELDGVLLRMVVDGREWYASAVDPYAPFGMVPPDLLVDRGLRLERDRGRLGRLVLPRADTAIRVSTEASLLVEGDLRASSRLVATGYAASSIRRSMDEEGVERWLDDRLQATRLRARLDSWEIEGRTVDAESITVRIEWSVPMWVEPAGSILPVRIPWLTAPSGSPFPAEHRTFPVDLGFPQRDEETVRIALPTGWTVDTVPERVDLATEGLRYAFDVRAGPEGIEAKRSQANDRESFPAGRYPDVRMFFDEVLATDGTPVAIGRPGSRR